MRNLLLLFVLALPLNAQSGIEKLFPATPTNFVTDAANLFSDADEAKMNEIALATQTRLKGDIAVVTLPDIGDYQPYEVAMTVGRTWKVGGRGPIGSEQRNLGVVVLVVPRTPEHKGECFIATGMGVEGFITDGRAGNICGDNIPLFRDGNYAQATINIMTTIDGLMNVHVNPPPPPPPLEIPWGLLSVIALVLIGIFAVWYRNDQKRQAEERERWRLQEEKWRKEEARRAEQRRLQAIEDEKRRKEAARLEKIRWDSLTPEQQAAELAERERKRIEDEKRAEEERKRRKKRDEEEAARRRRSSYNSYGSFNSSSSYGGGSSGSSFGGFGGGGGFSGGGGGRSF